MSVAELGLATSVFLACGVEAVEALTIVLAVGGTRGWRSALAGVAAAVLVLLVAIVALGAAVQALPIAALRAVVGVVLLGFGLQWLRKAVLRAAGMKALHDESSIYEHEREAALAQRRAAGEWDAYAFGVSFQGVLLEGAEVALIVVGLGAEHHRTGLAAAAAALSVAVVIAAGFAVRGPLSRVPENNMKFAVGVMLCSFGVFWGGEGIGLSWPGGEAILLALVAVVLGTSGSLALVLRSRAARGRAPV